MILILFNFFCSNTHNTLISLPHISSVFFESLLHALCAGHRVKVKDESVMYPVLKEFSEDPRVIISHTTFYTVRRTRREE